MQKLRSNPVLAAAVFALAAAAATPAPAADVVPGVRPLPGYSWQGPYVGANLGYQWGSITNNPAEPSGVMGGLQAGYNFQVNQFVFGSETDLQISGADDRFAPWKFSNPWFGTLRGRAGFALSNVLLFGTAGLAYGTVRGQNTVTGVSQSNTGTGWVIGVGMEVALTRNWTARSEYLYVDLSDRPFAATGVSNGLESHLLRFGVNYRF